MPQITASFSSLNLPSPGFTAHFVAGIERIGGILLVSGLLSRFTGLVLAVTGMVAYWTADKIALQSIISDPQKFYVADPFTFFFASLLILILGAGLFSLDRLFET